MDIQLRINKLSIQLGMGISSQDLVESEFRPAGLMRRFVQRLPRGQELFEATHCTIDCFDDQLSLFPCTHAYLNQDRQWETEASVLLVDGRVHRIDFRVINGVYAAPNFLDKFKHICNEHFGTPQQKNNFQFRWTNERLSFFGFLHPDKITADFSIECLPE